MPYGHALAPNGRHHIPNSIYVANVLEPCAPASFEHDAVKARRERPLT